MTTKIGGYQNRPVQAGNGKSVTRTSDAATSSAGASAPTSGSPIQITDQARQLAALEAAVQSMPVVNEARVAAIRLAIEQGSYEVAPERIADKLMKMETDLIGSEK